MPYYTKASDIKQQIAAYAQAKVLWVDTEVADFKSRQPRISLIQILDEPRDTVGDSVAILDVLDKPQLVELFIDQIMVNPAIEKVFHNASYDLKLLGKTKAKNVTCTLEMARKIPYHLLPLPNITLKTLAERLCNAPKVDKSLQDSDWGQRPLTQEQLEYAKMDVVYLAQVHEQLLQLTKRSNPDPANEDIVALSKRYAQLKQQLDYLNSEFEHIETRLKQAMPAQNLTETGEVKLSSYDRSTVKVPFTQLSELIQSKGIDLDFPITLTKELQKQLGDTIDQLQVEEKITTSWRLTVKEPDEEDDLPF